MDYLLHSATFEDQVQLSSVSPIVRGSHSSVPVNREGEDRTSKRGVPGTFVHVVRQDAGKWQKLAKAR